VPIELTLTRVEQDLAAGRRTLARQRLRGLVGTYPERLDLRTRLAELYRADGDLAQAGRWSYLSPSPSEHELAAFEHAHRLDLVGMMRALNWAGGEATAPSEEVASRLRSLRERAEAQANGPVAWSTPRWPEPRRGWVDRLAAIGCGFLVLAMAVVLLSGVVGLVQLGIDTLVSWLS
jgi:hypothetical protein